MLAQRSIMPALVTLLVITPMISGCFGSEPETVEEVVLGPFTFDEPLPMETFYHYPGAIDATDDDAVMAANISANLSGNNSPFWTEGTYHGVGFTTFEPTLGITGSGAIFFTNYRGTGDGTHIIKGTE